MRYTEGDRVIVLPMEDWGYPLMTATVIHQHWNGLTTLLVFPSVPMLGIDMDVILDRYPDQLVRI